MPGIGGSTCLPLKMMIWRDLLSGHRLWGASLPGWRWGSRINPAGSMSNVGLDNFSDSGQVEVTARCKRCRDLGAAVVDRTRSTVRQREGHSRDRRRHRTEGGPAGIAVTRSAARPHCPTVPVSDDIGIGDALRVQVLAVAEFVLDDSDQSLLGCQTFGGSAARSGRCLTRRSRETPPRSSACRAMSADQDRPTCRRDELRQRCALPQ